MSIFKILTIRVDLLIGYKFGYKLAELWGHNEDHRYLWIKIVNQYDFKQNMKHSEDTQARYIWY
jgi:hypothetical protein